MLRIFTTFFTLCVCMFGSFSLLATPVHADWATIQVEVTERIPWAGCSKEKNSKWVYICDVGSWFSSIMVMMGKMIQYFTYITALCAVLYIVINGILYSMSWLDAWAKDSAKKRIIQTLLWLVLLLLSGTLLHALAPWVYTV